jgi:hypothetical protein
LAKVAPAAASLLTAFRLTSSVRSMTAWRKASNLMKAIVHACSTDKGGPVESESMSSLITVLAQLSKKAISTRCGGTCRRPTVSSSRRGCVPLRLSTSIGGTFPRRSGYAPYYIPTWLALP